MKLRSLAISIALSFGATLSGFGQGNGQTTPSGSGVVIPDGTIIEAKLEKSLDANMAEVGDPVKLEVMLDVRDRATGAVLIPKKAKLLARVSSVDFPKENKERAVVSIETIRAEWKGGFAQFHGPISFVLRTTAERLVCDAAGRVSNSPFSCLPPPLMSQLSLSVSGGKLVFTSGESSNRLLPTGTIFWFEHRVPGEGAKTSVSSFESSRDAALKGEAEAQFQLGLMYHQGKGVAQDYAQAAEWYRKAAEQGVSKAQNNLAVLYAQGQGVAQDYVAAYMWFSVAAPAKRDKNPANPQLLESHMTPEQIAEGKRRAEEWLKQHPAEH